MSRIGKQIIIIPANTIVINNDGIFTVRGPKGELKKEFKNLITINIVGSEIALVPTEDTPFTRALWGTYASHIKNMIAGVNIGYQKKLIIEGVGFKSEASAEKLTLSLGFSHQVFVTIPQGLTVKAEKNVLTIDGIDKELVGQFANKVRSLKKPEPYKGKGIRYEGEVIRRKQGKKSA